MAKRYIRVNSGQGWENAPSVATPINKSNLNIMDKGLDDLDLYKIDTDAIANNLVTTEPGLVLDARQGKVLDDKVNTINNNLDGHGTWSPYLTAGGTMLSSANAPIGKYKKIGKYVRVMFNIDCNGLNGASGNVSLFTLPFIPDTNYIYGTSLFYLTADVNVEGINAVVANQGLILRIKKTGSAINALTTSNIPLDLAIIGEIGYYIS